MLLSSAPVRARSIAAHGSSKATVFSPGRVRLAGCVLSDIVKRRSLQARLDESPGRRTISLHSRADASSQDGVIASSAVLSAAPDRAAIGTISKQAGLSKFQVSGVGRAPIGNDGGLPI
jgi:hypothetical protein